MKKKLTKLIATMFLVFAAIVVLKVPVSAFEANFRMTSDPQPGDKRIEVQWNSISPSDISYYVTKINYYYIENSSGEVYGPFYGTGAYGDFSLGFAETWYLYCNYTWNDNTTDNYYLGYTYVNNSPAAITKAKSGIDYVSSNSLTAKVVLPETATGSQLRVYKGSKVVATGNGYSYPNVSGLKRDIVYTYRVRSYYENYSTGKKYYSKWSGARKYVYPTVKGTSKSNKKGFSITLKKVSGVTSYKVYVSTKRDSGYKLSKTVKPGKKSKITTQITKNVKKQKTCYIRVVPVIKDYGNSAVRWEGSIYVFK